LPVEWLESGTFSWQYASFLLLIAAIVIAAPFAVRQDWLGWTASTVTALSAIAILGPTCGRWLARSKNGGPIFQLCSNSEPRCLASRLNPT